MQRNTDRLLIFESQKKHINKMQDFRGSSCIEVNYSEVQKGKCQSQEIARGFQWMNQREGKKREGENLQVKA